MLTRLILLLALCSSTLGRAQQIALKGIITVQNSRINTGKTEFVPEVSVRHPNAKPTTTDSQGCFTLHIVRLSLGTQVDIEIKLTGKYRDYVVVNKDALHDITLGRLTPIHITIQDRRVLATREAQLIATTIKKHGEVRQRKMAALNKRIAAMEAANDFQNEHYQQCIDSLAAISGDRSEVLKRIKEYARAMVLVNLDEADSIYTRAYQLLERGELDSVAEYPEKHIDYKREAMAIRQQLQDAEDKKQLAQELSISAETQVQNAERAQRQLLEKLRLAAKVRIGLYQYSEAKRYYEQALELAPQDAQTLYDYANYLHRIREYARSSSIYERLIPIAERRAKEYPEGYLTLLADALNSYGVNSCALHLYEKADSSFRQSLSIREHLAKDRTPKHLADWAAVLSNLGSNYHEQQMYYEASGVFCQSRTIYEGLSQEQPETYLPDLADILNNLGANYNAMQMYHKADSCHRYALSIREGLAEQDAKAYAPDLVLSLHNLGNNYHDLWEYTKADSCYQRALSISETLVQEYTKVYLPDLAYILNNIGANYHSLQEYTLADSCFSRSLSILERLAQESPRAYMVDLAGILYNLGVYYEDLKDFLKAIGYYQRSIDIYEDLATKQPRLYRQALVFVLYGISDTYRSLKSYERSREYSERAVLLEELSIKEGYTQDAKSLAIAYSNLSEACLFTRSFAEVERYAREALRLNSNLSEALPGLEFRLAISLLLQGDYPKAWELYRGAMKAVTNDGADSKLLSDSITKLEELVVQELVPSEHLQEIRNVENYLKAQTQTSPKQ